MITDRNRQNWQLAGFTLTRLLVATSFRLLFPFLPAIARGLGVSLEAVALLVTLRSALGVAGPALGSMADHWGGRAAMLAGLGLFSAGLALVAVWPTYPVLAAGLVISGLGNIIVDSTIYAFLGDRFPYDQRARAMAVVEMGWSGAFVVGIPLAGWLIARGTWDAPFFWLSLLGLVALMWMRGLMPQDGGRRASGSRWWEGLGRLLKEPVAWMGLLFNFTLVSGYQAINIVYGAWMETQHNLSVEALGAASTLLGIAGIGGVLVVALVSDRIGKPRAIVGGIVGIIASCLALYTMRGSLVGSMASLFALYLSFEVALVSGLPLMTELVPGARATLMAGNVAAIAAGDAAGAVLGSFLFRWGMPANAGFAVVVTGLALVVLIVLFRAIRPGPTVVARVRSER